MERLDYGSLLRFALYFADVFFLVFIIKAGKLFHTEKLLCAL